MTAATLIRRLLLAAAGALLGYLFFWPVPIDPAPWTPTPNRGFTGSFAPNDRLAGADSIPMPAAGPEDLAIGPDGAIYTGLADGRVVRVDRTTGGVTDYARTGGRPLGLRFDHLGNLLIADGRLGLVEVSPTGSVRVVADSAGQARLGFTDALDIAPDGTVWWSDASLRFGVATAGVPEFIESRPTGRLLRYDPATGTTSVALEGLDFANGVAIGPDGAWLLLNETMAGRVLRFWIRGPNAGRAEVFLDGLPGFPDNVSYDGQGTFWVALVGPRRPMLDRLRAMPPWLRKVFWRIPERLRVSGTERYGMVVAVDTTGAVRLTLQDPTGRYHNTTGAARAGDTLYVGSLARDVVARIPLGSLRPPLP